MPERRGRNKMHLTTPHSLCHSPAQSPFFHSEGNFLGILNSLKPNLPAIKSLGYLVKTWKRRVDWENCESKQSQ